MRGIAEQLMSFPADLAPKLRRQRLGDDLRAVQRQPGPLLSGDAGGEAFRRANDGFSPHHTAVRAHTALGDGCHGGLFVDRHAEPLDRCRQPAHKLGRLFPCLSSTREPGDGAKAVPPS